MAVNVHRSVPNDLRTCVKMAQQTEASDNEEFIYWTFHAVFGANLDKILELRYYRHKELWFLPCHINVHASFHIGVDESLTAAFAPFRYSVRFAADCFCIFMQG